MLFEEHHNWKFITWLDLTSPSNPLNFRLFEGSKVNIDAQDGSCKMVSLASFVKCGRYNEPIYEIFGTKGGGEWGLVVEHQFLILVALLDYDICVATNS